MTPKLSPESYRAQFDLTQAAGNALDELRNVHRDALARNEHAPTGCPCSTGEEACPLADAINMLKLALGEADDPSADGIA